MQLVQYCIKLLQKQKFEKKVEEKVVKKFSMILNSNWLFQLRAWHISHIFLNDASLYDHEQMHFFIVALTASRWRS